MPKCELNDRSIEQTRDDANTFLLENGGTPALEHTYRHNRLSVRFKVTHDSANVHRFLLLENRTYVYKIFTGGDNLKIKIASRLRQPQD
jgi:hypothetical protein